MQAAAATVMYLSCRMVTPRNRLNFPILGSLSVAIYICC